MATGDLRGNLERLRMQLLSINYPHPYDAQGLKEGIPAVVLPLLHHALLGYSRHVARYLSASGYELYAKSDLRFMEGALRFFRQEFNYRCALTIAQIFSRGYAERKMIFIHDAIQMSKRKHNELVKLGREKAIDKAELTQINYDKLSVCGGISHMKNPRACGVQCVDYLPFHKLKSWEQTLRSSKSSLSCFKDPGCGHVDVPVLPVSETISPRPRNTDDNAEHHHCGVSTDNGSNIQSSESSIYTRVKTLSPKVKKHVKYQADFTDLRSPTSGELFPGDHSHQEICQRIMDMAEKLEARFSTLEAGVTRAKETLQEKLVSLEGRVRNLEASKDEILQTVGADWILADGTVEAVTGVPAPQPPNSQAVRDISNTHQCVVNCLTDRAVGTSQVKICEEANPSYNKQEPVTSNRDLIAGVRARFNRTLELLNQEAQITSSAAAPSC